MPLELPYKLPSIESVLHPERQATSVELEATDMQKHTVLKCGVCMEFPLLPVILAIPLKKCDAVFCNGCLKQSDEHRILSDDENARFLTIGRRPRPRCPSCRQEYRPEHIIPVSSWSLPLRRQWDMVDIKCPLKCPSLLNATTYLDHVNSLCRLRMVKCPGMIF